MEFPDPTEADSDVEIIDPPIGPYDSWGDPRRAEKAMDYVRLKKSSLLGHPPRLDSLGNLSSCLPEGLPSRIVVEGGSNARLVSQRAKHIFDTTAITALTLDMTQPYKFQLGASVLHNARGLKHLKVVGHKTAWSLLMPLGFSYEETVPNFPKLERLEMDLPGPAFGLPQLLLLQNLKALVIKHEDTCPSAAYGHLPPGIELLHVEDSPPMQPDSVALLTGLTSLQLCLGGDSSAQAFTALMRLQHLCIDYDEDSSCLGLGELSTLPSLASLHLDNFMGSICEVLLPSLTGLHLLSANLADDLSPLEDMEPDQGQHLIELNLSGSTVLDLGPLSTLKKLERLLLDKTTVTDVSPLSKCLGLKELSVPDCEELLDFTPLSSCRSLHSLFIDYEQRKRARVLPEHVHISHEFSDSDSD